MRDRRVFSWIVLIASLLAGSATVYFIALIMMNGALHGPATEAAVLGVAISAGLIWCSIRLRRDGPDQ